ncbi:YihY family inner membrane protein [Pseudoruegeria sp. HB172150]|uniref:YihY family inner membrane protein n=1 Tax=Pseudoruegeria sp. HB172150 TaxID=2721164 RepID=UPI001C13184C|nr:YihY family inner membrane protein [Pseudoruegeria sp. HB172150]
MPVIRDAIETCRQSRLYGRVADLVNFTIYAMRRFFADRLDNSVAALTYTSLLALVPLLVIAFSILSNFNAFDSAQDRMESLIFDAIVPEAGAALKEHLSSFTHNASDLTTLGVVGLAFTALLLLSAIESTLNQIWRVERVRPLFVRFLVFWAILTLGPLLMAASLTLTSDAIKLAAEFQPSTYGVSEESPSLVSLPAFQTLVRLAIYVFGFTTLFVLVPARPVRVRHALIGAVFAAIAFGVLAWGFNSFLFSGATYKTIYGTVAAVPIFLIWVYASWMVIVLGAVVAASIPDWRRGRKAMPNGAREPGRRLETAVALLAALHRQAQKGGTITEETLMAAAPPEGRREVFEMLGTAGYLVETESAGVALVRDLRSTTLAELASDLGVSLGIASGPAETRPARTRETEAVRALLRKLHEAEADILGTPLTDVIAGLGGDRAPRLITGTAPD